jgi:hypothetical protein
MNSFLFIDELKSHLVAGNFRHQTCYKKINETTPRHANSCASFNRKARELRRQMVSNALIASVDLARALLNWWQRNRVTSTKSHGARHLRKRSKSDRDTRSIEVGVQIHRPLTSSPPRQNRVSYNIIYICICMSPREHRQVLALGIKTAKLRQSAAYRG